MDINDFLQFLAAILFAVVSYYINGRVDRSHALGRLIGWVTLITFMFSMGACFASLLSSVYR